MIVDIYVYKKEDRFHILLRHPDGREELSDQSFSTHEECKKAIEQYVKDKDAKVHRVH